MTQQFPDSQAEAQSVKIKTKQWLIGVCELLSDLCYWTQFFFVISDDMVWGVKHTGHSEILT